MSKRTFLAASVIALMAVAGPVFAQHATPLTPAEKAAAEAAAAAAASAPAAEIPVEAQASADNIDVSERTIWDGVFTAAQAEAGAPLYTTNCAGCHGKTGRGTPGGPGITGANFNKSWEFVPLLDFFTFARTNMPPGKAGTIGTAQDYVNIVAYVLSMHGAEPGATELVYNDEQLANITIERKPK